MWQETYFSLSASSALRRNKLGEQAGSMGAFWIKQKQKWHLASSIEEEYYILQGTFVLPLPFKREKGENEVNESKIVCVCVYIYV